MSNVGLFIIGVAITVPMAVTMFFLLRAAVADGRENDRIQAERADRVRADR